MGLWVCESVNVFEKNGDDCNAYFFDTEFLKSKKTPQTLDTQGCMQGCEV